MLNVKCVKCVRTQLSSQRTQHGHSVMNVFSIHNRNWKWPCLVLCTQPVWNYIPDYSLNWPPFSPKSINKWSGVEKQNASGKGWRRVLNHSCKMACYQWCLKELFSCRRQALITCFHCLFSQWKEKKSKKFKLFRDLYP